MAFGLSARIRQTEKRFEAQEERLPMPISGPPERTVMLPCRFVEWMVRVGERVRSDGGWLSRTDNRWEDYERLNEPPGTLGQEQREVSLQ